MEDDSAHNVPPIRANTHVIQKRVAATVDERETFSRTRTFDCTVVCFYLEKNGIN